MGEIIEFSEFTMGCRRCANLMQIGKDTFKCTAVDWDDGTHIYPIVDGERNAEDWDACKGKEWQRDTSSKRRRSS